MKMLCSLLFLSTLLLLFAAPSRAGIQLDSTRVIYPADKREVTLAITNHADTPRLIQAWVDNGDSDSSAQSNAAPFIVMPHIFRLDPDKDQTLRIIFTDGNVPQDRESVFWLNVLEIQPKHTEKQADRNTMKVTIRTRLKLFYRPQGLAGSPKDALTQLRWRRVPQEKGYAVECENPTPWNISFNHVGLKGESLGDEARQSGMCPAKGKRTFSLRWMPENAGGELTLITIDDFGGYHTEEVNYSR